MDEFKEITEDILSKAFLMSLGMHDEGGVWVSDVIFTFDDKFNIYWLSHDTTRHSKAIEKNA